MLISSPNNPQVKAIRALRQRKAREQSGLFVVEGIRLVAEAVQTGAAIETLLLAPELLSSPFGQQLAEAQRHAGVPVLTLSAAVFASLSGREHPQGLAAVLRQRWHTLDTTPPAQPALWLALSEVADPGNLGTMLRTCDAVGAQGVVLLGDSTDPYDPAALRASMGAIFAQRLVRTSLPALATWARHHHYYLVGAAGSASNNYQAQRYPQRLVLLMGSERQGLSAEQQAICDTLVSIPMVGRSDSLNLAVAAGVLLYEVFHQWRR